MQVARSGPRHLALASILLAAAACGGSDNPAAVDAAPGPDAPVAIDAPPACMPALPSSLVLPAGGAMAPKYTSLATLTSTGELAVLGYDGANGEAVRYWTGTAWDTKPVYGNTNGGFGRLALGEVDGRAVVFGDISDQSSDSDTLRAWPQLASGAFATGQRIGNVTAGEVRASRYSTTTHVLSAAGGDQSHILESYERNAAGTWTVAQVASQPGAASLYAAGVGTLADGTAVIAGTGTLGFNLYRRSGQNWFLYHSIASGAIYSAKLEFPPAGATGTAAVAIYEDPISHHPRGGFVDLSSGVPTGATDLLTANVQMAAVDSSIVFEPGTNRGKVLFVDGNFNAPRAWIASFEGTTFTAAQELRPDRVFETYPRLVYHPCGGYQILHVARMATDPAGSAPLVFEPLATFAPGL